MMPKFRAWISEADTMANDLKGIDFENETVVLRKLYYEDGFPVETEVFEVEIGNAILMQSTGLRDMNNREIFEGDIITNGKDVMCMKRHNTLGFYVEQKGKVEFIADCAILEEFEEDAKEIADSLEIIGNIYENKGILEEKDEKRK
ncbi:YopX family protein [Streptococcus mitis]|uniref:YopX protein n=1 Tax=Streptococcus mitis TaxID=28037 RepID=A0A3R9J4D6_STRMT|nr:YopX family protein [Streptococcus mitis]RSI99601.1 YopX protein [Streptococcus mitis]